MYRAESGSVHYGFSYRLYDTVCPAQCRWEVKPGDVLVSLRKHEKGKWSRLLHDKAKVCTAGVIC